MTSSQAAPIVVLADLAPEGTSTDLEPGDRLLVPQGKLSSALASARITLEFELGELGRIDREHAIEVANYRVHSALSFDPLNLARATWIAADLDLLMNGLSGFTIGLKSTRLLPKDPPEEFMTPERHCDLRAALSSLEVRPLDLVTLPFSNNVRAAKALLQRARGLSGRPLGYQLEHWYPVALPSGDPNWPKARRLAAQVLIAAALEPVHWNSNERNQRSSAVRLINVLEGMIVEARQQLSEVLSDLYAAPATRTLEPLMRDLERLARHHSFTLFHCPRALLEQPSSALLERFEELRPRVVVTPHRLDPRSEAGLIESWAERSQKLGAVFAADTALELAQPIAHSDVTLPWQQLLASQRGGFVLFPQRYLTRGNYGPTGEHSGLRVSEPRPKSAEDRPWGSVALLAAPCLAAPKGSIGSLDLVVCASGKDASCDEPSQEEPEERATRIARVAPKAAAEVAGRWALGLCDVHASQERSFEVEPIIRLFVPYALMGRTPEGRLAHSESAQPQTVEETPMVVLADLSPEGTSSDLEPGDRLVVERGKATAMLKAASIALEFDVPEEHLLDPDDPMEAIPSFTISRPDSLEPHKLIQALPLGVQLSAVLRGLNVVRIAMQATRLTEDDPAHEFVDPQAHWEVRLALTASGIRPLELASRPWSEAARGIRSKLQRARARSGLPLCDALHAWVDRVVRDGDSDPVARPLAVRLIVLAALEPDGWSSANPTPKESRDRLIRKTRSLIAEVEARIAELLGMLYAAPSTRALEPLLRDLLRLSRVSSFTLVHCPRTLLEQPSDELLAQLELLRARVVVTPHRLDPRSEARLIESWTVRARAMGAIFAADTALDLAGPVAAEDVNPAWQQLLETQRGAFLLFPQRYLTRGSYGLEGEHDKYLLLTLPAPSTPNDRPWGSVALFLAPTLASLPSQYPSGAQTLLASGSDVDCYDPTPAEATRDGGVLLSRVAPPPPADQQEQRWALGLCDAYPQVGRGNRPEYGGDTEIINLLVPAALLSRSAEGLLTQPQRVSELSERKAFWRGGQRCLRCQAPTVQVRQVEGCRMNGDAWGTVDFNCACGWSTWLAFDDAFDIDGAYYFETKDWAREPAG